MPSQHRPPPLVYLALSTRSMPSRRRVSPSRGRTRPKTCARVPTSSGARAFPCAIKCPTRAWMSSRGFWERCVPARGERARRGGDCDSRAPCRHSRSNAPQASEPRRRPAVQVAWRIGVGKSAEAPFTRRRAGPRPPSPHPHAPGDFLRRRAEERTMSDRSFFKSGLSNFHQIIEP